MMILLEVQNSFETEWQNRKNQNSFFFTEPRLDKSPFGNGFGPHPPGLSPMAAQFMALNNPAAAAQAAFFSQAGALPPFHGLPVTSSPGLGGRHDPHHLLKGPAGLASLEALHR